jgi:hypothetical protein
MRKKSIISEPSHLDVLLKTHRYGKLVDLDQYTIMESQLFNTTDFPTHKEEIAKLLAGSIIQSNDHAVLIIKAEVYGRMLIDDAHSFDEAIPTIDSKLVYVLKHNNYRKLVIGTYHNDICSHFWSIRKNFYNWISPTYEKLVKNEKYLIISHQREMANIPTSIHFYIQKREARLKIFNYFFRMHVFSSFLHSFSLNSSP